MINSMKICQSMRCIIISINRQKSYTELVKIVSTESKWYNNSIEIKQLFLEIRYSKYSGGYKMETINFAEYRNEKIQEQTNRRQKQSDTMNAVNYTITMKYLTEMNENPDAAIQFEKNMFDSMELMDKIFNDKRHSSVFSEY